MCMIVLPPCMFIHHMHTVPRKARRGNQNIWNRTYRQLWSAMCILETKLRCPVRALYALYHWTISPAHLPVEPFSSPSFSWEYNITTVVPYQKCLWLQSQLEFPWCHVPATHKLGNYGKRFYSLNLNFLTDKMGLYVYLCYRDWWNLKGVIQTKGCLANNNYNKCSLKKEPKYKQRISLTTNCFSSIPPEIDEYIPSSVVNSRRFSMVCSIDNSGSMK